MLKLIRSTGPTSSPLSLATIDVSLPAVSLWNPSGAAVDDVAISRRGAHTCPTAGQLRGADDWTAEEKDLINKTRVKDQARTMKVLRHNRVAFEKGLHVIKSIEVGATIVSCFHCDYAPELGVLTCVWVE